jgi:hypothetical protein
MMDTTFPRPEALMLEALQGAFSPLAELFNKINYTINYRHHPHTPMVYIGLLIIAGRICNNRSSDRIKG